MQLYCGQPVHFPQQCRYSSRPQINKHIVSHQYHMLSQLKAGHMGCCTRTHTTRHNHTLHYQPYFLHLPKTATPCQRLAARTEAGWTEEARQGHRVRIVASCDHIIVLQSSVYNNNILLSVFKLYKAFAHCTLHNHSLAWGRAIKCGSAEDSSSKSLGTKREFDCEGVSWPVQGYILVLRVRTAVPSPEHSRKILVEQN